MGRQPRCRLSTKDTFFYEGTEEKTLIYKADNEYSDPKTRPTSLRWRLCRPRDPTTCTTRSLQTSELYSPHRPGLAQ